MGVKVACRDPCKIPFQRLMEMKKKAFLLSFKVEGFEQTSDIDPNDDDLDEDIQIEDVDKELIEGDKKSMGGTELGEDDEAIDELDVANRSSTSKQKSVSHLSVSAIYICPHFLSDDMHDQFLLEEKSKKSCSDPIGDQPEMEVELRLSHSPVVCTDGVGASASQKSAHHDYCFVVLKSVEESESYEENEIIDVMNLGSIKRSLLASLDEVPLNEKESKTDVTSGSQSKWGRVLIQKPNTRKHGRVTSWRKQQHIK